MLKVLSSSNYDEKDLCLDIVRCLINAPNAGVNLQDYENKTPLHYAERLKTVEVLLTREDIDPLIKDDNGKTPFCYAKEENKSEIVKALISNRYGVEKNNLLHLAAKKGYEEILGAILKEGVEVDVLNDQGESAVYLAAINRHFKYSKITAKGKSRCYRCF
ncbi:MAG: ankyrin repeat domain-containing protein [Wolbachia sp.]